MLLSVVLLIQIKEIYNNNLKYNRYLGYKQSMNEMSMDLNAAELTANKSAIFVKKITKALMKNDKEIKNLSASRVTHAH
ncbi:hypothetical protein HCN44_008032 [Aphidius gifuensis]|uniref:Uncharacterized protein n=1 Tax=Aphidius gifuensis TaxID=684658 RepID=A0A835CPN9_APHGI|nr:hypothetical protein HCN44_008032 [Aphidius gifuensis]